MDKEQLESMMIEYVDGTLNEADRAKIENLIQTSPEASVLFRQTQEVLKAIDQASLLEPGDSMKSKFEAELKRMLDGKSAKIISISRPMVYRIAAGIVLVLVSGAMLYWINRSVQQEQELARLKTEMEQTKSMMLAMLDNQPSAGKRIQAVSVANTMDKADDEIVNALVKTMDKDPNSNVRLAALEALSRFHSQPHVRTALIKSLETQTDPVVQIALIRLLVEIKEKQTLKELQRITTDENMLPAVKDEAHAGIMKLS